MHTINDFGPDLLLVGMGMPRQEKWLLDHRKALRAGVKMNVGALFDYLSGNVPMPPRWLGPLGLEWAYRLLTTPRRVVRRYLIEPWGLLPIVFHWLRQGSGASGGPTDRGPESNQPMTS